MDGDGEYEIFDANAMRRAEAAILGDMEDANPLLDIAEAETADEVVEDGDEDDELEDDVFNENLDNARGQVCVVHAIQLCVNEATKASFVALIRKTDRLVAAIRKSTKRQQKLFHLQRLVPIARNHVYAVLGRNATRWWSLLVCWERLLLLMPYVRAIFELGLFNNAGVHVEVPDINDVAVMRAVVGFLTPVKNIVTLLEGQSYYTLPHVPGIVNKLLQMAGGPHSINLPASFLIFCSTFAAALERRLLKYLNDATQPSLIAAVMCPTWGVSGLLNMRSPHLNGEICNTILSRSIPEWLRSSDCLEFREDNVAADLHPQMMQFLALPQPVDAAGQYCNTIGTYLMRNVSKVDAAGLVNFTKEELMQSTVDTQEWYDALPADHAPLKKLARLIFSISPSTASAEQFLSGAGLIDGPRRGRLNPTTLEHLVVAHGYLTRMSNQGRLDYVEFEKEVYNRIARVVDLDEMPPGE